MSQKYTFYAQQSRPLIITKFATDGSAEEGIITRYQDTSPEDIKLIHVNSLAKVPGSFAGQWQSIWGSNPASIPRGAYCYVDEANYTNGFQMFQDLEAAQVYQQNYLASLQGQSPSGTGDAPSAGEPQGSNVPGQSAPPDPSQGSGPGGNVDPAVHKKDKHKHGG